MWYIRDIKLRAWNLLRNVYWRAFIAVFFVTAISGAMSPIMTIAMNIYDITYTLTVGPRDMSVAEAFVTLVSLFGIICLFSFVVVLFLEYPLWVGLNKFMMQLRGRKPSFMVLLDGFRFQYFNVVKVTFFQMLFTWLWSLLLVIPGMVKSYEYRMVPYILSENPGIDWRRALELSRAMTQGEKWQMFLFDLSFIGWYLLGAIPCGIGIPFVTPYVTASQAELYAALRDKAFHMGFSGREELPGFFGPTV